MEPFDKRRHNLIVHLSNVRQVTECSDFSGPYSKLEPDLHKIKGYVEWRALSLQMFFKTG